MPRQRGDWKELRRRLPEWQTVPREERRTLVQPFFNLARFELLQARRTLVALAFLWGALCLMDITVRVVHPEGNAHPSVVASGTGVLGLGIILYSVRGDDERRKWWLTLAAYVVPAVGVLIDLLILR